MPDTEKFMVRTDPATFKISKSSAARLSAMSGLPTASLAGATIGALTKKFPHQIDPQLFLFRRICGKVVKTDPISGIDYPVAFATVQVEDTDCSFVGYFPQGSRWSWYFPFRCHREVIATVKTDACGNFCVWIPRFDIDWVLRFRRERKCFPIIFDRPDLSDLLGEIVPDPIPNFPPRGPIPDPLPFERIDIGPLVGRIRESFGRDVSLRARKLAMNAEPGGDVMSTRATLSAPALLDHLSPPLPPELRALNQEMPKNAPTGEPIVHPAVETLAARLGLKAAELKALDLRRFVGPFKRCFDVFFPEWTPIVDVPDITFKVLQDTNGDGVLEQIYGEGHFQVRWDSGSLNNLILHAGPNALPSVACDVPQIKCGNVPAIVNAGLLALHDPLIYNPISGYAVRTNRPHPSGSVTEILPPSPLTFAKTPFTGTLQLYGCNATNPGATHYRLMYRHSANGGANFTEATPFVNRSWSLHRLNAAGVDEHHTVTPDSQGWYPIALPPGPNNWHPHQLLLNWDTTIDANGLYQVQLEVGTGGVAMGPAVPEIAFSIDNSYPTGTFTVETADSPSGVFTPISGTCPVVKRGSTARDVYFRVTFAVNARHLRSVSMNASDCGAGSFSIVDGVAIGGNVAGTAVSHWHQDVDDNSQTLQAIYMLPRTAAPGTYGFNGSAASRAFNPAGSDGGFGAAPEWQYDPDHYRPINPSISFSVIDAD